MSAYRSHADLGARAEFFAPIDRHDDSVAFHAPWEARALAVTLAMGATGQWNIDASRSARETLPDYARRSYYAIWVGALEKLLVERGLVRDDELRSLEVREPSRPVARVLRAAEVAAALRRGSPTLREATQPAAFAVGDAVETIDTPASHHTRLPAYARGRRGVVERVHGMHVFADTHARGLGESPQWLYTVAFEMSPGSSVSIDAWQPYLRRDVTVDEPVFAAPWEAEAFAITVALHRRGLFGWDEWAAALGKSIAKAPEAPYHERWLVALEDIVAAKGLAGVAERDACLHAWRRAAERTPHGRPIELAAEDFHPPP